MSNVYLRPQQASDLVSRYIDARIPILLTGAPGVGKTSIVEQAAYAANFDLIISHPVVSDPTDFKGLPWPGKDGASATFLPFGELAQAINATKPTVWFLDDLGQSSPAVQAACMQLLLARRVNGHKLPDCVTFAAATNRRTDRAGVSGILAPVISRFGAVIGVEVSIDDWCQWAFDSGKVPPELIAFLRFRPELLNVPLDSKKKSDDMENFPCPRTWGEFVGPAIKMALPSDLEWAAFAGAVGAGAAIELRGFLSMFRSKLPNPDAIIADPEAAPIPDKPDVLWAITTSLAKRTSDNNCSRIFRYAERLFEKGHAEFAILMVRDITRLVPDVLTNPAWTKLVLSPLGKEFLG